MCHPYGLHDGRNRSTTDLLAWTATTTKLYRSCDKGPIPALVMAYGLASTGSWPFSSVYLMCQWVITHENSFWSLQLSLSSTFIGLPGQTCIRYYIAAVHVQQNSQLNDLQRVRAPRPGSPRWQKHSVCVTLFETPRQRLGTVRVRLFFIKEANVTLMRRNPRNVPF